MEFTSKQKSILKAYLAFVKKNGMHPTRVNMKRARVSRDMIRDQFGSLQELKKAAKAYEPAAFKDIIDESLFTPKQFNKLQSEVAKYKRFVVTTAVTGCPVHKGFFDSLKTYCKKNDAMLLVLTASDPAAVVDNYFLDPVLKDQHIVFDDLELNNKIWISAIKLSAKHIDPITGLGRIGQRNGSFIYASPKQRMKMTPTSNKKLPHVMMTTGAVTKPNYKTERYMSDRTAYIAEHDHVLGAIVVEIQNKKRYHFRQIQADPAGGFADIDTFYRPGSTSRMNPDSLVLGDLHSGETDAVAKACFLTNPDSVRAVAKPRRLIVHDGFNGKSINHHEVKNKILRAQLARTNKLSLQDELEVYAKDLSELTELAEEVVIVKSNHDEFLERYLAAEGYKDEPHNYYLGLKLAQAMIDGHNPLKYALEWIGLKHPEKIRWLDRDEDFKVARVELGAHGDKGAHGARGSLQSMESAYGNSVSGHSHTPEILRGAYQVGTLSFLKLNYNVGSSAWMHTSCLVFSNGMRQLINVIDGRWKI